MAQQKKDEEEIKTYKMIEGDYSVQIRILEANDLIPTISGFAGIGLLSSKGTACNAFIEVSVCGQVKRTKVVKNQLSPIFNQLISFKLNDMKKAQLSSSTINVAAIDRKNPLLGNKIIGSYELDLSSVYFSLHHEMYRTYLALSDPTDEREGTMGYILCNIMVLGPNDEPFVHDVATEKKADASKGATLTPKKIAQWPHCIRINLLKGEHMVPLDMTAAEIDAYVVVKYGGSKIKSKVVTSRNPEWYQQLNLACMLPNQSKFVDISVYDNDLLGDDDLVGTFQLPFKPIPEYESQPMWVNLYGAPLRGESKKADMMNLYGMTMGSHYRGRICFTICRFDQRDAKTFKEDLIYKFPENPMPVPEQKGYILRVDLLEGHEFPIRKQSIIQIKMGPYLLVSQPATIQDGSCMFYENLPDKKVLFPKNINEVPDIIIYMADDNIEDRRHSFIRLKPKDVLDIPLRPQIIKMTEDRSLDLVKDDEFPGFLFANIQLMSNMPGKRKPYKPNAQLKLDYQLRVYLYLGRNFPPADATGTSDPLVKIRCAGQIVESKVCTQTLNPGWYETLKLNVKLYPFDQEVIVPSGMFVMVFDQDLDEDNKASYDLIGRIWITLEPQKMQFQTENEIVDMFYRKPKWYNIRYDATDEIQGQILLAYSIIPKEKAHLIPDESIYPNCTKQDLNLFCIGLRNFEDMISNIVPSNVSVSFDISGDDYDPISTDYKKVKEKGVNINRLIPITVDVPKNQHFSPVIDCYVWNQELPDKPKLLGVQTIQLSRILAEYYTKLKLKPGEQMPVEFDESDEEENELMKKLEEKQKPLSLAQIKEANANDEEEPFDLDKIDLNIPQELPFKKRVVDDYEYQEFIKKQEEDYQRIKEEEEDMLKQSQIGESNVQDLMNLQDDIPVYRPTTFGGGLQVGQDMINQQQSHFSNQSNMIIEQFPKEEQVPEEQIPVRVTRPMDNDIVDGQNNQGENNIVIENNNQGENNNASQNNPIQSNHNLQSNQSRRESQQQNNRVQNHDHGSQNQQQIDQRSISQQQIDQRSIAQQQNDQRSIAQQQIDQRSIQQQVGQSVPQSKRGSQQQVVIEQRNQSISQQQQQQRKESQQQINVLNEQQPQQSRRPSQQQQLQQKQQSSQQQIEQQHEQQNEQQHEIQLQKQQSRRQSEQQQPRSKQQSIQKDDDFQQRRPSQQQLFEKQQSNRVGQSQDFQQKQPSIPISPIQNKNGYSQGSQQQIEDFNFQGNLDESRIVPSEPKSKTMNDQQQMKIGQRVIQPPIQGSQRSIRMLSQVDQRVVFDADQHVKNQAELSRRQSQQIQEVQAVQPQMNLSEQLQQLPQQQQPIKTLQVPTELSFSKASKVSSKALSVNSGPKGNMDAVKKPKQKKKILKGSKKAKLFGFASLLPKKKKTSDVETYEDFDTDDGEDLDVTPEWLKGRKFLPDDLEDKIKTSKKFLKYTIMSGQSRGKDTQFLTDKNGPTRVCDFKFLFLEVKPGQDIEQKKQMYIKMMRPKQYVCRLYFLSGIDIQSGGDEPPDLYIKVRTAIKEHDLKMTSLRQGTNNPQFYFPFEVQMEVPGSAIIEVEIWSSQSMSDELVGTSLIDLEDRYFSVNWHQFEKKPIENRNIKDEFGSSVGRLQLWIDLVEKAYAKKDPMIKITAPPRYLFELRVIIFETRNCVFKDELEKCNDLYCKAGIANQELQETDVHWRCRAKGSFNWRIKNNVTYPSLPDEFGTDKFKIQLWDKDIVGSDELIGETTFDLNTHKMIDKAVKRLQATSITQRIREKGGVITDRLWLDVYHPDAVDEEGQKISQGQVLCSFELLPLTEAEKKPNGFGRNPPNVFPPLNEPTGRLSFDITNPLGFIKEIMGPDLYDKICKFLLTALLLTVGVSVGWIFLGPLIANVIVK